MGVKGRWMVDTYCRAWSVESKEESRLEEADGKIRLRVVRRVVGSAGAGGWGNDVWRGGGKEVGGCEESGPAKVVYRLRGREWRGTRRWAGGS